MTDSCPSRRLRLNNLSYVLAIREMAASGEMTDREIAHEFCVSHVAITDCANGVSYRAFPGPIRHRDYGRRLWR